MDIKTEREAFEQHLADTGLVEFAGYGFAVDECDEYLHEPTQVAWDSWLIGLNRAKAQAVQELCASVEAHKIIIDEVKTEINDGYDLCQDSYLLDVLVHRGIQIGKAQAVPEGFVVFPKKQTSKMRSLARDFDARLSLTKYEQLHNIWVKQAMIEAQEQK